VYEIFDIPYQTLTFSTGYSRRRVADISTFYHPFSEILGTFWSQKKFAVSALLCAEMDQHFDFDALGIWSHFGHSKNAARPPHRSRGVGVFVDYEVAILDLRRTLVTLWSQE
jgi:hypothetical protein